MAATARRALARAATPLQLAACGARRRLPGRCAATPTHAHAHLRPLLGAAGAAPRSVATTRRWLSRAAGEEGRQEVSGIRAWTFDEVRRQVEANRTGAASQSKVVLVDVREPAELLSTGKLPGAINIPITSAVQSFHIADEDFQAMHGFARPPRNATLLFYCKAGVRARSAAGLARHAGWESVGEYTGSWLDWEARGGPVEKVSG